MSLSKAAIIVLEGNHFRWNIIMLEHQANQLRREQIHLTSKANQRPLTLWEKFRIYETESELTELLAEISQLQQMAA